MKTSLLSFRRLILSAGLIPLGLGLVTCGGQQQHKDQRQVFSYNELAGITSLDPGAASNIENIWAVNQLFNGLVQMDEQLEVSPCIARHWSISEDGLQYTFHLRTDVFFHDDPVFENGKGRRVLASDFVYAFNRLYDPRSSSALSLMEHLDRNATTANKGFAAPNDSTFILYLKKPFSAFLSVLTMKFFSVVPKEAIVAYGQDFRAHPVGTGPFQFKFWEEGTKLVLLKNPHYFETENGERLPYLDAVSISFIKDRETAFMEFLNGKFDMLSGADAFNINEVLDRNGNLQPVYQAKFDLQKGVYMKTDYLGILVDSTLDLIKHSPLRIKAIRQAINYGFDRNKLINYFRNGVGTPATSGFIPAGLPAFDPDRVKGYTYDPNKVRQLLKEAGFPEGKGLPEMALHTTDNYIEQVEFIQSQLAQNHIPISIHVEKASVMKQATSRCEFPVFKKSWVGDYADEENFMAMFYSKNFAPDGFNYTHYSNKRFDALFEKAVQEQNDTLKKQLYQEMDQLLMEDAPVVPLYYDQVIRLVAKDIKNLKTNPMNLLELKRVKKTIVEF